MENYTSVETHNSYLVCFCLFAFVHIQFIVVVRFFLRRNFGAPIICGNTKGCPIPICVRLDIQYAGELHMSSTLLAPINDTVHNVMTHNYMDTVCSVTFGLHLNTNILTICHHWLSSDVECSSFHFLVFVSFLYGKRPVLWRKYRLPSTISAWNWTPLNFS